MVCCCCCWFCRRKRKREGSAGCVCGATHSAIAEQRRWTEEAVIISRLSPFRSLFLAKTSGFREGNAFYRRGAISIVLRLRRRERFSRLRPRITRTVISLLQCVYAPLPARHCRTPFSPRRVSTAIPPRVLSAVAARCASPLRRVRVPAARRGGRSPSWTTLCERALRGGKERRDRSAGSTGAGAYIHTHTHAHTHTTLHDTTCIRVAVAAAAAAPTR